MQHQPDDDKTDLALDSLYHQIMNAAFRARDSIATAELLRDYREAVDQYSRSCEFFSVRDLERRWKLTRKAILRLPVPRHRIGGAIRYSRADVLHYEWGQRSAAQIAATAAPTK
jgi:hypothetical protein